MTQEGPGPMTRADWSQDLWGLGVRTSVGVLESLLPQETLIGTRLLTSGPVVLPSPLVKALNISSWLRLTVHLSHDTAT